MPEIQAGVTALITAYARANHATRDDPNIFDDFLADAPGWVRQPRPIPIFSPGKSTGPETRDAD